MKGLKLRIRKVGRVLNNEPVPDNPVILNDVKLEEFKVKMEDLIENYVYFNQDNNIVKASEILSEMFIYVLVTANTSGLEDLLEEITKLVCDDVIEGTVHEEIGHRIPIVTQGNQTLINLSTGKKNTFSTLIASLIYRRMEGGFEDLRF